MSIVSILEGLLGLAKAAPDIVDAAKSVTSWMKDVSGNDPEKFIKESAQVIKGLFGSKTLEERYEAAKGIANIVHNIPSSK